MKLFPTAGGRVAILSMILALPLLGGDWPLHRGNAAATGNNDDIPIPGNKTYFSLTVDSSIESLSVAEGTVYFTTERGWLYAADEETGDIRWKRRLATGKGSLVRISGNRLVVPGVNGLTAIQRIKGSVAWTQGEDVPMGFDQVSLAARLVIGHLPGKVMAFAMPDGKAVWSADAPGSNASPLVVVGDEIYLTTQQSNGSTLTRIARDTGALVWQTNVGFHGASFPLVGREKVYLAGGTNFLTLSRSNGDMTNRVALPYKAAGAPFLTEAYVTIPLEGGILAQVDPRSGVYKRTVSNLAVSNIGATVLIRDTLYLLDNGSTSSNQPRPARISGIDLNSGELVFTYDHSRAALAGDLVASSGRLLLSLDQDLASIGPDGQVWFGSDRHGSYTNDPAPRKIAVTNFLTNFLEKAKTNTTVTVDTNAQTTIVKGWMETLTPEQRRDRFYNFYGELEKTNTYIWHPGKTNVTYKYTTNRLVAVNPFVLTNVSRDITNAFIPVDFLPFAPKPRPPLATVALRLKVKDGNGKAVAARVEVITRDGGRILERKVVEPGESFDSLNLPRPGNTEILVGLEGYMDNKAEVPSAEKNKAVERTVVLTKIETGKSIVVENIRFDFNKATLLPESVTILDRVRETLQRSANLQVEVRGFTDNIGGDEENIELSLRRAQSVREYLVKNGIPVERLTARGMGMASPIADNNTESGRSKNRRTEFYIVKY